MYFQKTKKYGTYLSFTLISRKMYDNNTINNDFSQNDFKNEIRNNEY